jgi:ribosomal protein L37AE/L43A
MAMTDENDQTSNGKSCPTSVVIVREGQLCPNCRFARLVREPGNIIQCPVCGYGTTARYT